MPEVAGTPTAPVAPALVRIAHLRRVHGVHGEVHAQSLGGDARRFARGLTVLVERDGRELTLRSARQLDGDELLLAFAGIDSREAAARLIGDYLCVAPDATRRLPADEWFIWQLVGLRAVTAEGTALGVVVDVEPQPASDVLVVRGETGERRFPMVRQWVRSVDVTAGVIVLTPWPELTD